MFFTLKILRMNPRQTGDEKPELRALSVAGLLKTKGNICC